MEECPECGARGGMNPAGGTWLDHVSDHADPHKTLDLVRKELPVVTTGNVPPSTSDGRKSGDWHVDVMSKAVWFCLQTGSDAPTWVKVSDLSTGSVDLSGYATKAELSAYVKTADLDLYLRKSDLSGYNFVTPNVLGNALSGYASKEYVASSLSAAGFLTQAQADLLYASAASFGSYVTSAALSAALAPYLKSSVASSAYVTKVFADSDEGYVKKGDALPYVDEARLAAVLSGYARSTALSGFLTRAAADGLYAPAGSGQYAYVTVGGLADALSGYLKISGAGESLSLSQYLKTSDADSPDGFLRKRSFATAASSAGLVTSQALSAALSVYVTTSSLSGVAAAVASELSETFATKKDLSDLAAGIAIQSGNGTVLSELVPDADGVKPVARSNGHVVLTGQVSEIRVVLPLKSEGAARDFILSVSFDRGTSMWGGTSFTVVPVTRQSETVPNSFYSVTDSVFDVDATEMDLDSQMVVFGFTEVAPSRFLVTRKTVTLQGA